MAESGLEGWKRDSLTMLAPDFQPSRIIDITQFISEKPKEKSKPAKKQ